MSDVRGECRAHGQLGAVHMSLGNYNHATKCYSEQLERAREVGEAAVEAQAHGNLGIARLNMGHYEDAIGYLEQQLATLEPLCTPTALLDKVMQIASIQLSFLSKRFNLLRVEPSVISETVTRH